MPKNHLNGRPLIFGDREQARLATSSTDTPIYDERPGSPFLFIPCIVCLKEFRIRKLYSHRTEKMVYVTPRIHTCLCGARVLIHRHNSENDQPYDEWDSMNEGEVVYRHLGAYEDIDELAYRHAQDSWKFYEIYGILENGEFSRQNTLNF